MALTKLNANSMLSGSIIQTKKTVITTPFTIALGQTTDTTVTGMTVNITPSFSNSIILLTGQIMGEHTHPHNLMFTFFRDSTKFCSCYISTRVNISINNCSLFNLICGYCT